MHSPRYIQCVLSWLHRQSHSLQGMRSRERVHAEPLQWRVDEVLVQEDGFVHQVRS